MATRGPCAHRVVSLVLPQSLAMARATAAAGFCCSRATRHRLAGRAPRAWRDAFWVRTLQLCCRPPRCGCRVPAVHRHRAACCTEQLLGQQRTDVSSDAIQAVLVLNRRIYKLGERGELLRARMEGANNGTTSLGFDDVKSIFKK